MRAQATLPDELPAELTAGPYMLQIRSEAHREDAVDILRRTDDIARWTHVPFPYGDAEFDEWLCLGDSHYVILENGALLGSVGAGLDPESRTAEVGYWLSPSARGKGVATVALLALCRSLFEAGYERLYANVLPGNPKSEDVLERAGFQFEGVLRSVYSPRCGLHPARHDMRRFSRLVTDSPRSHGETQGQRVVNVNEALATFAELWSPRVIGAVNDYDVRVAKVQGEHLWHAHLDTDEFFFVLAGTFCISLRQAGGERDVTLQQGEFFVVPRGVPHRPYSEHGASILMFERRGTSSIGDYEGAVPEHIDSTLGRVLTGAIKER